MPRSGGGIYTLPAGLPVNGETSNATDDVRTPFFDLEADMNTPRPVVAGGTGAADAATARANLGIAIGTNVQAYDADLASWASVTRASGFDTFVATPNSANLRALLTDEVGTGAAYFVGGALGTPASGTLTNCTGLTTSGIAAATLVTAAEGLSSNNNDTTIPTCAAVNARSGNAVLITRTTLGSAAATIDFTTGFNPAIYSEYEFRLRQVLPVTDAAQLWLRTSTNAGSSYDAGASDYNFAAYTQASAGGDAPYGALAAQFALSGSGATSGVGNAANEIGVFGSVRLFSPNTARFCPIQAETHYQRAGDGLPAQDRQWGHRVAAADVDAVRFLFSTGNIAAGSVIEFWGIAS